MTETAATVPETPPPVSAPEPAPAVAPAHRTVIEPLAELTKQTGAGLKRRYNFDLMMGGGHLTGYQVVDPQVEAGVIQALTALAAPESFKVKYSLAGDQKGFLFAMGDGNHSLATAKAIWAMAGEGK